MELIDKAALVAWIKRGGNEYPCDNDEQDIGYHCALDEIRYFIDTLEVKDVDLIIHTIIAECCDWLAMNTNLSHDKIEGCRNLMLTVKEEQFKTQKRD